MDMTLVGSSNNSRINQQITSTRTRNPATVEVPKDKTMMNHRTQISDQKLLNSTDPPDKYTRERVLRTLQAIFNPEMLVPLRELYYLASVTLNIATRHTHIVTAPKLSPRYIFRSLISVPVWAQNSCQQLYILGSLMDTIPIDLKPAIVASSQSCFIMWLIIT